jgi:hypothetical protein
MKMRVCFPLIFAWIVLLALGNSIPVFCQQQVSPTRAILGFDMAAYTAPDRSYSILVPQGWTAQPSASGITFVEKASDPLSARIDLFVIQLGQTPMTSAQFIQVVANQMKTRYPSFQLSGTRALAQNPDVTAVLFVYQDSGVKMSGFGMALCNPNVVLWTDIYGKDEGFRNYNPAMLLTYVLQSMSQGTTPASPHLPQPATIAQANQQTASQKTKSAMLMTHYWNMYPHLYPGGVFRAY